MSSFVALGLLAGLLALAVVVYPLIRPAGRRSWADPNVWLEEQRFDIYRHILEVELDQQTGRLEPAVAQRLSAALLAEAAMLLARQSTVTEAFDEQVEREIEDLRRALTHRWPEPQPVEP